MDFSTLTLDHIDAFDKEFIKKLSWNDLMSLYTRCKKLGRGYFFGGKLGAIGNEQPFYARDSISLEKNMKGKWGISVYMNGPDFIENPEIIDEVTFVRRMLELGVPQEKLDEFLKYEVNWDEEVNGVPESSSGSQK